MTAQPSSEITRDLKKGCPATSADPISMEARALVKAVRLADKLAGGSAKGNELSAAELLAEHPSVTAFPEAALLVLQEGARLNDLAIRHSDPPDSPRPAAMSAAAAACLDAPQFPRCGDLIASCRLVRELGRGVEGRVFLAHQIALADRPVVLKMTACNGEEHLNLARLFHSHIVPLLFVQDLPHRNLRVLGMPYLGGASLARLLHALKNVPPAARTGALLVQKLDEMANGTLGPSTRIAPGRLVLNRASYCEAVCLLGACLADALQFAHERGLVHLDVKPGNILLAADGQPLLLDFHLARAPLAAGAPAPIWFGGTPKYMAPEQQQALAVVPDGQVIPQRIDGRADLYSLGSVLFEMLSGVAPANGQRRPARFLRRANSNVSPGLADIVSRCLAANATRRYNTAADLAADLRRHAAYLPLRGVANRSLVERYRKWRRRAPHGLVAAGAVLSIVAVLIAYIAGRIDHFGAEHHLATQTLIQARELVTHRQFDQAEEILTLGLSRLDRMPWSAALAADLDAQRRHAQLGRRANDMAILLDDLRYRYDGTTLSPMAAPALLRNCARFWEQRDILLGDAAADEAERERRRIDLLDLAILWSNLRVSAQSKQGQTEEHRQAVQILREAAKLGASSVLDMELAQHRAALGETVTPPRFLSPQTAWEHYALGRSCLRNGKLIQARDLLASAVAQHPGGFGPRFHFGVCCYRLGQFAEAAEAFAACTALAPDKAIACHNHGLACLGLGRVPDALLDFDRAIQLEPGWGAAWLQRAACHLNSGAPVAALKDLDEALAHGADSAAVHYNRALAHLTRHDWREALANVRISLQEQPDHVGAAGLLVQIQKRRLERR